MMLTEVTEVLAKNTHTHTHRSTTVSTTHPTQNTMRMNPDVHSEGLATNRLTHGTAVTVC